MLEAFHRAVNKTHHESCHVVRGLLQPRVLRNARMGRVRRPEDSSRKYQHTRRHTTRKGFIACNDDDRVALCTLIFDPRRDRAARIERRVKIEEVQLRFSVGNGTKQLMETAVIVNAVACQASRCIAKPFELARLRFEQAGGAQ